ncbi:hexokinase-1-like [Condylostylus longicornis]|uniref:hexokinase-1-like n=1 Tax=Condylostylus longicornis TaxID=2530218 RepID=UPI00244DE75E|nr:hexokinase-1-like [Condylostylus longicornis]
MKISSPYTLKDLQLADNKRCEEIKGMLERFHLNKDHVQGIVKAFESEIELALKDQPSSLLMENTYIPELPDGTEKGLYLALDLGGTNFRVILLELDNAEVKHEYVQKFHIDDDVRVSEGDKIFDFLAKCVNDFLHEHGAHHEKIAMGFTFSFPMKQHSLHSASLKKWTKSFHCPAIVGEDVVLKLQNALNRIKRSNIEVLAIMNDTTGTLLQGAKLDHQTRIGIVVGTGTNAAYIEHAERVKHWEQKRHGETNVVVVSEWGGFGDNGVIDFCKTEFDIEVDQNSLNCHNYTFEKYISGKYIGETCRVIIKKLQEKKLLFANANPEKLPHPYKFCSSNLSSIEDDHLKTNQNNCGTKKVLEDFGYVYGKDFHDEDIEIVQYIVGIIEKRAATLLSAVTSVLVNRMDESNVTVAIDGSVYKHHHRFRQWYHQMTNELAPEKNIKFILAEDGSGKGAALAAAIARKIEDRHYEE